MKLITRHQYLHQAVSLMGTPDIKVITGIRRSGKSSLLSAFADYIVANVADHNIIRIDYNDLDNDAMRDYHKLHEYAMTHYAPSKHNFLFIDEVQLCPNFELALNSLHAKGIFDIYITGSNAFLLSSDLATLFTGRTFPVEMYPFSFKEYCQYYPEQQGQQALDNYVQNGGMPGSYVYLEMSQRERYLRDLLDTLILRDIKVKYAIRNPDLLWKITDFLLDNIGNLASARSITAELLKHGLQVSDKTVGKYLEYLCNAFLFYRVRRYDLRGKKYLTANDKYYVADCGFRLAQLGRRNLDYGRVYENIVALELLRRGYQLYVGVLYGKEVDFVAQRGSEKIYIQVASNISEQATFEREVGPLQQIRDAYPKMLIVRIGTPEYDYNGIRIIDLVDWLQASCR